MQYMNSFILSSKVRRRLHGRKLERVIYFSEILYWSHLGSCDVGSAAVWEQLSFLLQWGAPTHLPTAILTSALLLCLTTRLNSYLHEYRSIKVPT